MFNENETFIYYLGYSEIFFNTSPSYFEFIISNIHIYVKIHKILENNLV